MIDDKLVRLSDVTGLLRKIEKLYHETYVSSVRADMVTHCIDRIKTIPAVDAVEVVHGRWEGNYPQAMFRLKRCSVCETLAPEGWYCFFCGAKMDGCREDGDAT